jgi:uncharacterized RDD family membrane protein YckC
MPSSGYPGERLGLPREGRGSIGRFGRRLVAAVVDWTLCQLIAYGLFHIPFGQGGPHSFVPLGLFALENLLLVSTLGHTIGHRLVGLRVRSLAPRPLSPVQVLIRTLLLCFFLPAMFWDSDGRGLHDKAAGTLIVRM